MRIPANPKEYWSLSREERKRLFEEHGISHWMIPTVAEWREGITVEYKKKRYGHSPLVKRYLKQLRGER